jgi:hypothetical protein
MRMRMMALGALATVLVAAAPGPSPVITMEGMSAAVKLSPELRAALAPQVKALNAHLEKIVAVHTGARKATAQQRAEIHEALKAHHDECKQVLHEMIKQMDPEQRAAFHQYLHEQLKAAGIEIPMDHDHGAHSRHVG